jgi:hypothetical protein
MPTSNGALNTGMAWGQKLIAEGCKQWQGAVHVAELAISQCQTVGTTSTSFLVLEIACLPANYLGILTAFS